MKTPSIRNHPLEGIRRQNIRITGVKLMHLSYRLKPDEEWPDADNHVVAWKTEAAIVNVSTDVGITGLGSCNQFKGPRQMKEYTEAVIAPVLRGKNPYDVEALSGGISGPGGRGAWGGVDTALWDIIAKSQGVPLYKLLAIDTEPVVHVPVYASGGEFSWRKGSRFVGPDDLIAQALAHRGNGYRAFKFRPGAGFGKLGIRIRDFVPYLQRIRQAVGPEFQLIQEANMRWSVTQCLEIAPMLEALRFLWFEEPTGRRPPDYLAIREALPTVKISGGEKRCNRAENAEMLDSGAYDIVQHSCDDAGVTEAWHMARMAHTRGRLLCTHNWGDGLMAVANAHLMAASPNRFLLEMNMTPDPFKEGLLKDGPVVKDGYFDIPDKPGLGVELREGLEEMYPPLPGECFMQDPEMPEYQLPGQRW
ncbi:MAG: mandelate racemase/muconate lactonizing enzyme family protein [Bryobacteraceae bacterium]|nr:mandelate racemase/muconate lactonizing enzyme family protein [Bryobacteraceae bacterium]